jgi:hypothetical protein
LPWPSATACAEVRPAATTQRHSLLGGGERLFDHLGDVPVGYACTELTGSDSVVHVLLERCHQG